MNTSLFLKRTLLTVLIPMLLGSCKSDDDTPFSNDLNTTLTSALTGIDYPIGVYLPDSYEESNTDFPVIYALDGQFLHSEYKAIVEERNTDVILVSIFEGPDGRRDIDYLLPGATTYYEFLTTELIPFIEEELRASPTNRTIVGASNGGLFVHTALFLENPISPFFTNYTSADAPFFGGNSIQFQTIVNDRVQLSNSVPGNLILTGATQEGTIGPFDADATAFQSFLESLDLEGLTIYRRSFDVNHFQVALTTMDYTLETLFE